MRILITGGGGYLGTVLVRDLLARTADQLTILDRFSWGAQPLLSVIPQEEAHRVQLLSGDIRDPERVATAVADCFVIIHLAGIVGYPACDADPHDADTTNVRGTQILCATGRPVLFASTGSTYGKVAGEADEQTPINPLTRYGRNKAMAEQIVGEAGGMILRLATLYGLSPRMRWDLLPHDFARRAVQEGTIAVYEGWVRRTFLHVEDAARAFAHLLHHENTGVWNIGHASQNHTKQAIAGMVREATGCALTAVEGQDPDQRDYAVNYAKIGQTAWQPRWTLPETLPAIVQAARIWR